MKKILTLLIVLIIGLSVNAQTPTKLSSKPKITKDTIKKVKKISTKKYFIIIDLDDYREVLSAVNNYRSNLIYVPTVISSSDQKIQNQSQLDIYLAGLQKRIIIDSLSTDSLKTFKLKLHK